MKTSIVVQHRQTKAYVSLGAGQRWTDCVVLARLFETPFLALHFCVDQKLQNADVVFRTADGREKRFLRC